MTNWAPVPRRALGIVRERLQEEPVILLEGPRSVGESTLLRSIADEIGSDVTDLDDLATRDAVSADPAFFVRGDKTAFIDEYCRFDNYLRLTLGRDATEISRIRQAAMLPRLLECLAAPSAQFSP